MAMSHGFENYLEKEFSSGDYTLLNKINDGFFSSVFKARVKVSHQDVVVKFIHLDCELDEMRRLARITRFEQECRIAAMLSHPNIACFLDKSEISNDVLYVVFEYIDGLSLDEYIKLYGALDVASACIVMSQILDAMAYIHRRGIIHCDIKPSNILLSKKMAGTHAVLVDFGISLLPPWLCRNSVFQWTSRPEARFGTPAYCSPEQLRGENVTYKSDLYMWGLVFLECLTGMPAISGATLAQLYRQHLSSLPIPIPDVLLTHPLGDLLQKVLQKNASDRTANAAGVLYELRNIAIGDLTGKFPRKILPHEDKPTIDLAQKDTDG